VRRLRYLYLAYFSKPAADRAVYRAIGRLRPQRILEIGIGTGQRAVRMIRLARQYQGEVSYTAIDPFESRTEGDGLSLKAAYRLLRATGARINCVPGDALSALARTANSLAQVELVVVSADQDQASLAQAWFYLPRTLHPQALVLEEVADVKSGLSVLQAVSRQQVEARSQVGRRRRAA
jgi:predicted O-methyltransferase YrrM